MARVIKIRHAVNPEDVYVKVPCTETGKTFRISLDGGHTSKTCRCSHETFDIYATPAPGYLSIEVYVTDRWDRTTEIENFDAEIDEE